MKTIFLEDIYKEYSEKEDSLREVFIKFSGELHTWDNLCSNQSEREMPAFILKDNLKQIIIKCKRFIDDTEILSKKKRCLEKTQIKEINSFLGKKHDLFMDIKNDIIEYGKIIKNNPKTTIYKIKLEIDKIREKYLGAF